MKFSCESCQAQYMISDDKVGPTGVRVRCKKCQHINLIKPVSLSPPVEAAPAPVSAAATPAPEAAGSAPATPAPRGSNPGLDIPKDLEEEIGNALDSVFTESQIPAPSAPAAEPGSGGLVSSGTQSGAAQQAVGPRTSGTQSGAQPSATTSVVAPAPISAAAAEWFVAINDEQVGPLRAEEVKVRWEKGEIGADTLVWCGRMPDWRPLSAVEDLARLVVPIRSQPTPLPRAVGGAPSAPLPNDGEPGIGFKPSAASAMASLASLAKEEISAADRSRKVSQPVKAAGSATAGLLADLPAPTDQIPVSPRPTPEHAAPEHVEEAPVARTPRLTRESYEAGRSSGGGLKWAAVIAAVAVVSVGSAGAAYWFLVKPKLEQKQAGHDEGSAPLAKKEAPPPVPVPAPPVPVAAATPTPPPVVPPPPPPSKEVAVAKTPAVAHAATPKPPPPPPSVDDRRHRRDRGHAGASDERPPRTVAAAGGGASNGEDFLNGAGESNLDKEFAKELEGSGEGAAKSGSKPHSVYIPPPPGQGDLPQALSQSQIMETVVQHKGSFAKCVQEQKKRDASSTGTLVMRWKIRPDGHTADIVSKGGDYQDSPLAACLRTQITRMHFGGYRGPQMAPIDFPFTF